MALDCRFQRMGPLLYATFRGVFTVADAQAAYRKLLDECVAVGAAMVLMDCREVEGDPKTMERFDFARFMALETVAAVDAGSPVPRIALVGRSPLVDPRRFGETVAVNRGAWVKVTTELDEAMRWLEIDPSTLPASDPAG